MNDAEIQAVQTLLERGAKVNIPAPLFFKRFTLSLKSPTYATLLRISEEEVKAGITVAELAGLDEIPRQQMMIRYGKPVSYILALALLYETRFAFLSRYVARLLRRMQPIEVFRMVQVFNALSDWTSFENTIRSAAEWKVTEPNLSPTDQGS